MCVKSAKIVLTNGNLSQNVRKCFSPHFLLLQLAHHAQNVNTWNKLQIYLTHILLLYTIYFILLYVIGEIILLPFTSGPKASVILLKFQWFQLKRLIYIFCLFTLQCLKHFLPRENPNFPKETLFRSHEIFFKSLNSSKSSKSMQK